MDTHICEEFRSAACRGVNLVDVGVFVMLAPDMIHPSSGNLAPGELGSSLPGTAAGHRCNTS